MSDKAQCDRETATATPQMAKVGLSFTSIEGYAKNALQLLKDHGDDVLAVVDAGFRAFMALSTKDYPTLFAALNDANKSAETIYNAVKTQFNL